ncbi:hypothetical protein [Nonomuraea deserti]|uniref:hypothetical protein n=1 Tax=Nonomuraea deserti TaxID=1848322 RepID=UPI00140437A8|nr:hypothetical protein [Nonomuraea deserti]
MGGVLNDLETVEPLLRATATVEIDAIAPLGQVVRRLGQLSTPIGGAGARTRVGLRS